MKRFQDFLFTACVTTILAAAASAVVIAAEDAAPTQDLVSVKASDQVMAARWTRQPDSYVLLVALDRSKASTRKPSGIPKGATLSAEQALRLVELERRVRDESAKYRQQQLAERPAPAADAAMVVTDRGQFFIGNTIASLRGEDPWFGCDRMLTLVDGRRVTGQRGEPAQPPRFQPPSTLNQPYPPTLKESRVEAWLLKADGTQILPTTYSCNPGVSLPSSAVEISYVFAVADSAQAVAAAIRIDGDYYIEKLQPLGPKPAAQ